MRDSIRLKLHFGVYRTPRFRIGAVVEDEIRGPVKIVKLTDAPIPRPIGKAADGRLASRGLWHAGQGPATRVGRRRLPLVGHELVLRQ